MARRRKGRAVSGILLLDKPPGYSSNGAMVVARAIYRAAKAGHTGALDPLATGVLPICFGEASKFSRFLLEADKVYRSTVQFGQRRATCDAEGEVIAQADASALTVQQLEAALTAFRGAIEQVPPMYSALKRDGRPLYELARQGIEVERAARKVTIFELELEQFTPGPAATAVLRVRCSKGTYIRSLADDLGLALGCYGHVATLRRLQAGPFAIEGCRELATLQSLRDAGDEAGLDALLLPITAALGHLPRLEVGEISADALRQGQAVQLPGAPGEGTVVLCDHRGDFFGVGEILDDGRVTPRRLLANV